MKRNKLTKIELAEEICPHCDSVVEIPSKMGVYKCPECDNLIISCSMCKRQTCTNCRFEKYKQSLNKIKLIEHIVTDQCNVKCMIRDEKFCKDCTHQLVLDIIHGDFDDDDYINKLRRL